MIVNQGARVEVALPDFTGTAGFVENNGVGSLSYPAAPGAAATEIGGPVEVDGRAWIVQAVAKSQYVKGFRVLTLRREQ